ncbi:hypothetical protein VQL36_11560 [Chengkuizengella sp. SCS-71B]|uniref:hypothetical protein n=1 Tax=Chengkuizengella sp. SCS-71B TaxID=3115290 RepID=UPI0032C21800
MAEKYSFFNSTNEDQRTYEAQDWADYFSKFLTSGIYHQNNIPKLEVKADGDDMRSTVETGNAFIKGFSYENTSDLYLTHDLPEPDMDRIDRIVLRLDKNISNRYVKAFVVKGVSSADPQPPALQRDEWIYEISLAQVRVIAGKSFIEQSQITDERFDEDLCGLVSSLISVPTNEMQQEWDAFMQTIENSGFVPNIEKGAADGVATLDGDGNVPTEQLGNIPNPPDPIATNIGTENGSNVQIEIDNLKSSVSDGKILIRNAIIDRGGTVSDADDDGVSTFQELSNAISTVSPNIKGYIEASWTHSVSSTGNMIIDMGTGYKSLYIKAGWEYFYMYDPDVTGQFKIIDLDGVVKRTVVSTNLTISSDFNVFTLDDGNDLLIFKASINGVSKVMAYNFNLDTLLEIYDASIQTCSHITCDVRNGDIYLSISEGDNNYHINHYSITGSLKKTSLTQGATTGDGNWYPRGIAFDHTKEVLVMWGVSSEDAENNNNDLVEWDIYGNTLTPRGISGLSNDYPDSNTLFFDDYGRCHYFARYYYRRVSPDSKQVYTHRYSSYSVTGKGQTNRNGDTIFSCSYSDKGYLFTWSGTDDELGSGYSRRTQVNDSNYHYNWWFSSGLNMQGKGAAYSKGKDGGQGVYAGMTCYSYAYLPTSGEYLIGVKEPLTDFAYINTLNSNLFDYNSFNRIKSGDKFNISTANKMKGAFVGRYVFLEI